MTPWQNS